MCARVRVCVCVWCCRRVSEPELDGGKSYTHSHMASFDIIVVVVAVLLCLQSTQLELIRRKWIFPLPVPFFCCLLFMPSSTLPFYLADISSRVGGCDLHRRFFLRCTKTTIVDLTHKIFREMNWRLCLFRVRSLAFTSFFREAFVRSFIHYSQCVDRMKWCVNAPAFISCRRNAIVMYGDGRNRVVM